ncbi:N-(5-amino-5-carboxypentanoyl)-L-cysteinyl-D-valine synthase [Fopius arisanus]|uniref:N-(5-amino-5-carboxypentanoyl)-L-cysteinyl-D- valine synthase n=1 Tax=Fopius arisanus TaxID=64838 RepID=A0A9R1U4V2_9HYME|nr:PREDICTED: N-(5-amino-5-carboxypentanoyl)-L-cysteinyl-D-valine synthase [Fopius arisanus]
MGSLQQHSILKGDNINWKDKDNIIHRIFEKTVKNCGGQAAIIHEDENGGNYSFSYDELESSANRLARNLRKLCKPSAKADSIVAVSMIPSHNLPIILLSILKSGMAYLPLDVDYPESRVKHILGESEPLMVIIDGGNKSIYEGTLTLTFNELWEESADESDEPLDHEEDPEQLAIVLYTSGSTGVPKGVRLPHATLVNRLLWQWRELPFRDDEQICIFKTALTFVDSGPEIWGPLLQGRTIVVVPKQVTKDPERFIDTLEKHNIQRLVLVPSLLQSILMYLDIRNDTETLKSLRLWICSGETLSQSLAHQFFTRFSAFNHTLANFYGSTEVMGDVTYHLLNETSQLKDIQKVPIGRPLDNCIIYLVNEDLRLVAHGDVGEVVVAGRNLAAGYIRGRDPHKFVSNPHAIDPEYSIIYRTGDYARIVKGILIYEGRTDSQVKIRGHRVDLAEVEKSVGGIPTVDKAVVLCYKPGELAQALLAFVTVKTGASDSGLEIENHLRSALPSYMIPQVIVIEKIPLLINGKTDRQALLAMYETSSCNRDAGKINCDYTGVPENLLAKAQILFSTVASVIGTSGRFAVDINANFYELGGNSLNSIYTVTKLREQGFEVGITDFLKAKNMMEILEKMSQSGGKNVKNEPEKSKFIIEVLDHSHRADVTHILTESFYLKADLERWLAPDVLRSDYHELMAALWHPLVEKGLSFVVKSLDDAKTMLGVALSFDAYDEPDCVITSKLAIVFEFLEHLEAPLRETKLPVGKGKILHCYMMATNTDLSPADNVIIMSEMERELLELATDKGYLGIFTTNTSPLTQQLDVDVYGYEVLLDYQVNQYVAPDGTKPFGQAPDDQRAVCCWKTISPHP